MTGTKRHKAAQYRHSVPVCTGTNGTHPYKGCADVPMTRPAALASYDAPLTPIQSRATADHITGLALAHPVKDTPQ